jgi:hypothetical protein
MLSTTPAEDIRTVEALLLREPTLELKAMEICMANRECLVT